MKTKLVFITILISAILITALFYKQSLGLNLFIYEILFLGWLLISRQLKFSSRLMGLSTLGLVISAAATVVTHSIFSFTMNFCTVIVFTGILIYPEARSVVTSLYLALHSIFASQIELWKKFSGTKLLGRNLGGIIWKSRIFVAPLGIIIIFITIYSFSNPVFNKLTVTIGTSIENAINYVIRNWNFAMVLTFIFGIFISTFLIIRTSNKKAVIGDTIASDRLIRTRRKGKIRFSFSALKNEYKAAIFLLIILNIMILVLNMIDVSFVWFNFEWEGQYLKQFVHEGTYLLIVSILISMAVVLYFFRGNLNFYKKNKVLKYLSYVWLAQNGILTISVLIRNFWYIYYFSLAYKRIGVIMFLALVIFGLITILIKVYNQRSTYYLLRSNMMALYLVLLFTSLFNWDGIIARYNFKNYDHAFVHLNYLSTLSDNALPDLDLSMEELNKIQEYQSKQFPFQGRYMAPEQYNQIIQDRKSSFIYKWEHQDWLSWNLPEYIAYRKLVN